MIALLLSKRLHSLFLLRMFNDTVAAFLGYVALLLFIKYHYRWGCVVYSLGVGIKMNLLLQAPGIFLILLFATGFQETAICLTICAAVQILVAFPFLSTYPVQYMSKAFELDRVFTYKWTVNFKFLTEEVFLLKGLGKCLLLGTALSLLMFAYKWSTENAKAASVTALEEMQSQMRMRGHEQGKEQKHGQVFSSSRSSNGSSSSLIGMGRLSPYFTVVTIFTSNFIGVVFCRTLHYQFYSWYFHSLPLLLWHARLPMWLCGVIMVCIEVSFNVFPATAWSSLLLQACHLLVLVCLFIAPAPLVRVDLQARTNRKAKMR